MFDVDYQNKKFFFFKTNTAILFSNTTYELNN